MFACGYLTLGKRPYMALLIGITLAVVIGAGTGDISIALWRSGDVIFGSLLALLFTSIYPQHAIESLANIMRDGELLHAQVIAGELSDISAEMKTLCKRLAPHNSVRHLFMAMSG